jgi:broad specificity phosphatase PhoE
MKKLLLLLSLLLVACFNTDKEKSPKELETEKVTTFYFIRHAEKATDQGKDPELTTQGNERAQQWVNYFFLKEVDHVISSDFKRTKATAAPLAKAKKLPVEIYDVNQVDGKSLLNTYRGKSVVLFGHSNTINTYANALQNDSIYKELNEKDYNHFFVVRVDSEGNSNAVKEFMYIEE